MSDSRPVAVTGATGFVGQAVLDEAAAQGLALKALTRRDQPERAGVEWVRGDLQDTAALRSLAEGTQAVLHIAGVVSTPDPGGFQTGNVGGTEAVVRAAQDAGVSRFVFVSSLSAREPGLSAYGRSKKDAESVVEAGTDDWTIVRPPAIYGPRDREILELFKAARWGIVPMPPEGRTSLIHVEDLARLLIALIRGGEEVSHRIFEPDDGKPGGWSHAEFARAIGHAVGRDRVLVPRLPKSLLMGLARADALLRGDKAKLTADRVGYMAHSDWVCDPAYSPPEHLWSPQTPSRDGLVATAKWYREQGWLAG